MRIQDPLSNFEYPSQRPMHGDTQVRWSQNLIITCNDIHIPEYHVIVNIDDLDIVYAPDDGVPIMIYEYRNVPCRGARV